MSGTETTMRVCALLGVAVGLTFMAGVEMTRAGAGKEANPERIASLLRQLGHPAFAKREAASKELEAVGAPALDALRKAASDGDPEIRRRAERILQAITARIRAAAATKELARWVGSWEAPGDVKMTIKGDRFTSSTVATGPRNGGLQVIEVRDKVALVDFVVEEGDVRGQTGRAILRLEGNTLHYCVTFNETRPTEFKNAYGNYYIPWKRVQK